MAHKVVVSLHAIQAHTILQLGIREHHPLYILQSVSGHRASELCNFPERLHSLASECEKSHRQNDHLWQHKRTCNVSCHGPKTTVWLDRLLRGNRARRFCCGVEATESIGDVEIHFFELVEHDWQVQKRFSVIDHPEEKFYVKQKTLKVLNFSHLSSESVHLLWPIIQCQLFIRMWNQSLFVNNVRNNSPLLFQLLLSSFSCICVHWELNWSRAEKSKFYFIKVKKKNKKRFKQTFEISSTIPGIFDSSLSFESRQISVQVQTKIY